MGQVPFQLNGVLPAVGEVVSHAVWVLLPADEGVLRRPVGSQLGRGREVGMGSGSRRHEPLPTLGVGGGVGLSSLW